MDSKSGSRLEIFMEKGVYRYPGETDAELRVRIMDRPVVISARDAFYRIMNVFNKDKTDNYIKFVKVKMVGQQRIDIDDIKPFEVLGKFEPTEITDEE